VSVGEGVLYDRGTLGANGSKNSDEFRHGGNVVLILNLVVLEMLRCWNGTEYREPVRWE